MGDQDIEDAKEEGKWQGRVEAQLKQVLENQKTASDRWHDVMVPKLQQVEHLRLEIFGNTDLPNKPGALNRIADLEKTRDASRVLRKAVVKVGTAMGTAFTVAWGFADHIPFVSGVLSWLGGLRK